MILAHLHYLVNPFFNIDFGGRLTSRFSLAPTQARAKKNRSLIRLCGFWFPLVTCSLNMSIWISIFMVDRQVMDKVVTCDR